MVKTPFIPENLFHEICRQAEKEYPRECCGFLLASKEDPDTITAVNACRNVQDDFHAKDPLNFPRSAGSAYYMDPADLLAAHKSARAREELIRIIYHSHIDAAAYFSDEDKRNAIFGDEPLYPDVDYLVIAVHSGKAVESSLYRWNGAARDFDRIAGRRLKAFS